MIAPSSMFERATRPSRSRKLAASLLDLAEPREKPPRPVPVWQGWLLASWVTLVAVAYFTMLAGLWR